MTGSDGINSVKLGLLTAVVLSHISAGQRARELGSARTFRDAGYVIAAAKTLRNPSAMLMRVEKGLRLVPPPRASWLMHRLT
jgi:hypothetical protein